MARANGQACGDDACAQSFENEQESGWDEPKRARTRERLQVPATGLEQGTATEQEWEQGTGTELEPEQEAQRKQELEPWNEPEPAELQPWNEREPSEQKAGQSLAAEPLERRGRAPD
jgi:hypothetical protein